MLTSSSNPVIKLARSLRTKKDRTETGLFLVEGIHHVGEAAQAGWSIQSILYAPDLLTSDFAINLINKLDGDKVKIQPVSSEIMNSLAEKDNPSGLLALVQQRDFGQGAKPTREFSSMVALVTPQDPGNVGSILRTMDATGVDGLFLLDGGVDIYHPSVIRASMGAFFWKHIAITTFDEFVRWAGNTGIKLVGTSSRAPTSYRDVKIEKPWALVFGSEQKGLSSGQQAACDLMVSMPMRGRASSLNLSVAAGILLYAWFE
jgi:TrmH family RNA methyltransferase